MSTLKKSDWRIDSQFQTVFKWSERRKAFTYFGSFYGLGITPDMKEEEQLEIIQDYIDREGFYFDDNSDWTIESVISG